jgi:beta-glucosidase
MRSAPIGLVVLLAVLPRLDAQTWKDPSQPLDARVQDLVGRLTLEEKVSQLLANPPAIPRLGIAAYSHRNECLHGVAGAGNATVFPQAIGMAATWDAALIHEEADAISTEARAKHNDYVAHHGGNSGEHFGLNFYSPNINIFRDPRWGRGQETYGEDPFLTARIGVAFIRGLQGNDPTYVKVMACAKHYAVHSGPESERHFFDAKPPERDLYDTYLPAFEAAVREAHVGSVMGAYSSLQGLPCCADPFLLTDLLRRQWGFDGLVFSDGGAIGDIWAAHHYVPGPVEAAAAALKAGCDVSSGGMAPIANAKKAFGAGHANNGIKGGSAFAFLTQAVKKGLVSEKEVDKAVTREFALRFRLGMFDPPDRVPYSKIGIEQNDSAEHRALALRVAEESIVLLKNDRLLPLDRSRVKRIAVIGPNADAARMQSGNYPGENTHVVTVLEGIKAVAGPGVDVAFAPGCPIALKTDGEAAPPTVAEAVALARTADVVIYVGGLNSNFETEEKRVDYAGFHGGDRTRIELPPVQENLIRSLAATGKPVVFVNCTGSAVAMPWEADHLPAIIQAWYPGEEGGRAVAEVLFGEANPAGRLPITLYAATADLPPFDDYSMAHRTYRYFEGRPLYAFGHGLSYTRFGYSDPKLDSASVRPTGAIHLEFEVKNVGARSGDEVAQVYWSKAGAMAGEPKLALCAFTRLHIASGDATTVTMTIPAERLRRWDEEKKSYAIAPGRYELLLGAAANDIRLRLPFQMAE